MARQRNREERPAWHAWVYGGARRPEVPAATLTEREIIRKVLRQRELSRKEST